ncbi:hypothetical protein AADZ91_03610 [Colwelliaceae bacterium 6441]
MTNVVEMVNFKLSNGFTKADFLSSNEQMNQFLDEQEGLIYRSLCEKDDGAFIDIIYWENIDMAKKAQEAFYESPLCEKFAQGIEKESVQLEYVKVVASFGCDGS